ncbi:glucokinase [Psychromicrobium silvestre]|uniref:Glucokinase n=1 Tax=Psychromicrobium silvestre TaxID=1645614 RepID=A0A7Y9LSU1_9MICC|nr:ROK family protein [Psychromicrobium silvestre]NYE94951.1 glucokinase [Psychromicrobium silvestre]
MPSVPLHSSATPIVSAVLAFDVGGTDTKAGLVLSAAPGEVPEIVDIQRFRTALDAQRPGPVLVDFLDGLLRRYATEHPQLRIAAVGVTVPGLVDEQRGIGIYAANLGWRDYPFRAELESRMQLPVSFGHDVGAAGDAEVALGAGQGAENAMILVVGTGIAAALYIDGRRLRAGGYAGEVGHAMAPAPDGGLQIMEATGSAGAIGRRYLLAHPDFSGGAREVLTLAKAGDTVAQRIWAEAIAALAFSIAQAVAMIGISKVVIGGGLAEAGDELFEPLAKQIDQLLSFQPRPVLVKAMLGQNAGLIGSALKAQELLSAASSEPSTGALP